MPACVACACPPRAPVYRCLIHPHTTLRPRPRVACACLPRAVRRLMHPRTVLRRRVVPRTTLRPRPRVACACLPRRLMHPRTVHRRLIHPHTTLRPRPRVACAYRRLVPALTWAVARYRRTHQVRSLCVKTSRVKVSANLHITARGHPARVHPRRKRMVSP